MPPDPSGSIANTQDVVILTPVGIINLSALAPDVQVEGVLVMPSASITISALAPEIWTDLLISIPAATITITPLAPSYG
jgi:hypothetical protein